jgi:hypothetical protein
VAGSDPLAQDTDGDGLNDFVEVTQYHTSPSRADTDGDGLWDSGELLLGRDPNTSDAGVAVPLTGLLAALYTPPGGGDYVLLVDLNTGRSGIAGAVPALTETFTVLASGELALTVGPVLMSGSAVDPAALRTRGELHTPLPGQPLLLRSVAGWFDGSILGMVLNSDGTQTAALVDPNSALVTQIGSIFPDPFPAIAVDASGGVMAVVSAGSSSLVTIDPLVSPTVSPAIPLQDIGTGSALLGVQGLAIRQDTGETFVSDVASDGSQSILYQVGPGGHATALHHFDGRLRQMAFFPCQGVGFGTPVVSPIALSEAASALALGDFDGDGLVDAAVAGGANAHVTFYRGDAVGGFTPAGASMPIGEPQSTAGPAHMAVGNLNGDGFVDLVIANPSATINGATHIGPAVLLGGPSGLGTPAYADAMGAVKRVWLGDVDGVAGEDLLAVRANATFAVGLNDGTGHFTPVAPLPPAASGALAAATADLDGDGLPEIILLQSTVVQVWLGVGPGQFAATPVAFNLPFNIAGVDILQLEVADLNLDGKPDLLATSASWFINRSTPGNLLFEPPALPGLGDASPFVLGSVSAPLAQEVYFYDVGAGGELRPFRLLAQHWVGKELVFLDPSPSFNIITMLRGRGMHLGGPATEPLVTLEANALKVWRGSCR